MKALLLAVAVLVRFSEGKHEIYEGNEVYKLKFDSEYQISQFHEYEESSGVDVWQHAVLGHSDASVMVTPGQKPELLNFLGKLGVQYELDVEDVMTYFQQQDEEWDTYKRQRSGRLLPFENYPRYAEVDEYIERIAAQYPNLVNIVNAGQSWENRPIKYLTISSSNFQDESKPIVFIDSMIHAREWVTTPVSIYAIHRLVEDLLASDEDLIRDIDWIILPIVNPDGYEFTHTTTRLWRKTRSNNHVNAEACPGVDGNRNFDFEFAQLGSSANPCGETFPGEQPFSEPETAIVRDIMHTYLNRIQLYLNIHSHGNYVLFGFGNRNIPSNGAALHHVGAAMGTAMDAMKLPQAGYYLVGNSALVLYATSGSAQDYAQHIGIPLSYTLELPGYGYNFQVPPQFIQHVVEETWEGIKVGARLSVLYYRARIAGSQ